jgi:uncharacterized protein (TIGR03086 family)
MNLHAEMTEAADAAARTVDHVHAGQFGGPTPCTDWDVRALLNHLILWTSYSLEARAQGGSVGQELTDRDFADEPGFAAGYRAQLDRALSAWADAAAWERELNVMGTATPAAAASGAAIKLVLSPTPPVECLSTLTPGTVERSTFSPE